MPIVRLNGADVFYEVTGQGRAVVFLHAGVADSRMWDEQFSSFADRYRVVRFDARGFGRSPLTPGRFSPVDDVRDLLDELGIDRAALVGSSYGGAIALDVAIAYPERVWALVLVAASIRGRPWGEQVGRFQDEEEDLLARGDLEAAVELNLGLWVDGPKRPAGAVPEEIRRHVGAMQREIFELDRARAALDPAPQPVSPLWKTKPRLSEIRAPTLVLAGDVDLDDVLASADVLAERIPGARSVTLAGAAHMLTLERPAEFDRLVLEFLGSAA